MGKKHESKEKASRAATITSAMIIPADGTTAQNITKGTGIKRDHIQDGAINEGKLQNKAVASAKIKRADGTTGQDITQGYGIKTRHIQDEAITSAKIRLADCVRKKADGTVDQDTTQGYGIKTDHIQDEAVTTAKIQSAAVETDLLANYSVTSIKIATADSVLDENGNFDQDTETGEGVKTGHIKNEAVTEPKIKDDSVSSAKIKDEAITSVKIKEAEEGNPEYGIKTTHIQNLAVTNDKIAEGTINESKFDQPTKEKLVTGGDSHDHSGGDGARINHSSLNKDDGVNPHGLGMSQLNDLNANNRKITNLANPAQNNDAANKGYVDAKYTVNRGYIDTHDHSGGAGARINHSSLDLTGDKNPHQITASDVGAATMSDVIAKGYATTVYVNNYVNNKGYATESYVNGMFSFYQHSLGQVNASSSSTASSQYCQVNASHESKASQVRSQVNASYGVEAGNQHPVCGGWGYNGPSPGNRRWELSSRTGNIYHTGSIYSHASFSDYGEYFENLKKGEIDIGLLIALEGVKVRPANKDEDFIGVVSGTAAIRLGDSPFCWQGRYMVDEWGRPVYEEIKDPAWEPQKVPDEKWQPKKGETEADRPMKAVESEKDRPTIRVQKENPGYDSKKEQEPRSERPKEWTLVGLLGQVYVRCDDTVKPGDFVRSKGKGIGTKAHEKTGLRGMKVTKEFDGKYSIVYCLIK